ncbi:hypothetical protein I7I50_02722 [Histoplasma capsulatum G186AR]|uniref:Uncharacterized protein n=1 Tax=Ajellomyces capsulatus TaxID=5037 RepID=A0A8H7Z573_AJECA|nr:hypothetical protein I7I52_00612 [Histoplasma capsulatum]QSS71754.1 hypothetical protein I7I50_02722 [Histoplasma capsulatum G186AR]
MYAASTKRHFFHCEGNSTVTKYPCGKWAIRVWVKSLISVTCCYAVSDGPKRVKNYQQTCTRKNPPLSYFSKLPK